MPSKRDLGRWYVISPASDVVEKIVDLSGLCLDGAQEQPIALKEEQRQHLCSEQK